MMLSGFLIYLYIYNFGKLYKFVIDRKKSGLYDKTRMIGV
ncbi:hypothetical protein SAMN02910398_01478 [Butyrivibrio sp. YAB3001]|nr:hypothetical protein SAMN02910398_01478 [Butyrivibrio sp. YAB3001]